MPSKIKETVIRESECPACEKKTKYELPKTKKIKCYQVWCNFCGFGYACLNGGLDDAE